MTITQFTERLKFAFFEQLKKQVNWEVNDIRKAFERAVNDVKPIDNWSIKKEINNASK